MPQNQPDQQFLIIQTSFIGDVVLSLPVAQLLKSNFPDSSVSFLIRKGNENLLENHPDIDSVFIWDKKNGKYRSLYHIYRELKKHRWSGVLNLHRFFSTGLLTSLLPAEHKAGFDKNPLSRFYDHKSSHEIPFEKNGQIQHEVDRNLQLLSYLGISGFERPRLYPSRSDYDTVATYKNRPYYVFAPSSVWFTKQWPQSKWVELAKAVPETITIILIGGPGDREYCDVIANARSHCVNLAGELTFLQSAALIDDALVSVVNDSAPLHFSSAVNTPTVSIFCSTVPEFGFFPLADNMRVVETPEELYCRPCGLHGFKECPEGHFQCAHNIGVESVMDSIEKLTAENSSSP